MKQRVRRWTYALYEVSVRMHRNKDAFLLHRGESDTTGAITILCGKKKKKKKKRPNSKLITPKYKHQHPPPPTSL